MNNKPTYATGDERIMLKNVAEIKIIDYFTKHKSLKGMDWPEIIAKLDFKTFGNYPISISLIKEVFWSLVHRGFIYIPKPEGEEANLGKVFKRHTSFNKKVKDLKRKGVLAPSH